MRHYNYTVIFQPAEEGGYIVTVPALPGLITEGDTFEEAKAMAIDAIKGYLEALVKDGKPVPEDITIEPRIHRLEVAMEFA